MHPDPRVGTELAGHRIDAVIGRGGMSVVYLAEHLRLGRKVALKVLGPELAEDEAFQERFIRESRIAAGLDHPNVVTVYDAGEAGGVLYISMRYVEGSDLERLLRSETRLESARAVSIVSQCAFALDAAHAEGLVHRDVKPANILLSLDPRTSADHVYLSDFGVTKQMHSGSGLTRTGQFVGTVDYVAPEQIQGEEVDGRADIYSLGCVLYRCLTGEVPFPRQSEVGTIYAHLQDAPPPPSERLPELPVGLDPLLSRALAKSRAERFGTCGELAEAVANALGSAAATSAVLMRTPAGFTPGPVAAAMEFRILGPIEVGSDRGTLGLGGRIQRALLANLLLHANQVVSADRLTEDLWGEEPPLSASHMLHVYVSRLRKELAEQGGERDILLTRPPGYLVRVQPPDRLDLDRFEALRRDGRRALEADDPQAAASALHEAMDLWRGPPLSGFEHEAFAQPEIARLEELRLVTLEDRIEADLALGRHADAVAELRTLTASHPLRERLWMLLALGLYRSGRQGDALSALQTARQTLADELGVDPGSALVDMEAKILRQDPALEWSPPAEPVPQRPAPRPSRIRMGRRSRRRNIVLSLVVALALIAAGAIGIIVLLRSSPTKRSALVLRQIDPTSNHLLPPIPAPSGGRAIAVSGGTIAVIAPGRVVLIDPSTRGISGSITLPFSPTKIVGAAGSFFLAGQAGSGRGEVARVDLTPRPRLAWHQPFSGSPTDLVVGLGFAWVLDPPAGEILRFGLADGQIADSIPEEGKTSIALGGGFAWLADSTDQTLVQLDPRLKTTHPLPRLRFVPGDIVFLDGILWVMDMDPHANLVWPIDPANGQPLPSIKVGNGPYALATTPSSIWVGNSESVTRILTSSNRSLNITGLPGPRIGIAADPASPAHRPIVWLLIAAPAPPSSASPSSS